ncbi:hypothetical protein FB451DRAFT_1477484 [Mycena latifolia]|nr:hypothetical protein FB451DRAFT_1477484 [Mycena latifolia]
MCAFPSARDRHTTTSLSRARRSVTARHSQDHGGMRSARSTCAGGLYAQKLFTTRSPRMPDAEAGTPETYPNSETNCVTWEDMAVGEKSSHDSAFFILPDRARLTPPHSGVGVLRDQVHHECSSMASLHYSYRIAAAPSPSPSPAISHARSISPESIKADDNDREAAMPPSAVRSPALLCSPAVQSVVPRFMPVSFSWHAQGPKDFREHSPPPRTWIHGDWYTDPTLPNPWSTDWEDWDSLRLWEQTVNGKPKITKHKTVQGLLYGTYPAPSHRWPLPNSGFPIGGGKRRGHTHEPSERPSSFTALVSARFVTIHFISADLNGQLALLLALGTGCSQKCPAAGTCAALSIKNTVAASPGSLQFSPAIEISGSAIQMLRHREFHDIWMEGLMETAKHLGNPPDHRTKADITHLHGSCITWWTTQ